MNFASFDGPFIFFLIDADIKNDDPEDLINALIEVCGERPSLFIGTTSNLETRVSLSTLENNEHNEILITPLELESFKDRIDKYIEWAKEEEYEDEIITVNPENYLPIRIKNFYLYKEFPYDVYTEVTKTRYQRVITKEAPFSLSKIIPYAKKNVKFFFVEKNEKIKHLEKEILSIVESLDRCSINSKEIYPYLIKGINILHEYINFIEVTPDAMALCDYLVDKIFELSKYHRNFKNVIASFPKQLNGISTKSLMTAFIAEAICQELEWTSSLVRKKLIVSSLLQDIKLDNDNLTHITALTDSELLLFSQEEVENFVQHPIEAGKVASLFTNYTDIDYIIEFHHELPDKKGFPKVPHPSQLTPICGVFNIAQHLASKLDIQNKITNKKIKLILHFMEESYNLGTFKEPLKAATKAIYITGTSLEG